MLSKNENEYRAHYLAWGFQLDPGSTNFLLVNTEVPDAERMLKDEGIRVPDGIDFTVFNGYTNRNKSR